MSFQGDSYIEYVSLMARIVHGKFEVPKLDNIWNIPKQASFGLSDQGVKFCYILKFLLHTTVLIFSIVNCRLVIHSNTEIAILQKDPSCENDCYQACGNIANEDGLSNIGDDVILRWFHFRLSDLHKYVGNNPKRVYVYAQTVIIDEDIDVEFSLFIRARQVSIWLKEN